MGIGFANLEYLSEKRLVRRGERILDIGSQNLHNATPERVVSFVRQFGKPISDAAMEEAAERLSYFSTPRPGERTTFLSDLLELTDLDYLAYDVCPAPRTEIFDLNIQRLPAKLQNSFDLVLNFGTTEHVINQLNAFEVMHDAMKVGGIAFHQIPSTGWAEHGYFNYNGLFLDDLVAANDYEVIDKFYTRSGQSDFATLGLDIRNENTPLIERSSEGPEWVLNFMLNYVIRKKIDAPFCVGLEIATTHAVLSQESASSYGEGRTLAVGNVIRTQARLDLECRIKEATQRILDLENSTSWKITQPLRAARRLFS